MHLIHLLERVPPAFDGIGDFAHTLAQRLEESGTCTNSLLPMRESGKPEGAGQLSDFSEYRTRIEAEITRHKGQHPDSRIVLLLHYNRGGFHEHGLHWHLNSLLKSLKKSHDLPLILFFHEFLPSRAPRRLHRFLRPLQVIAARGLIGQATRCFTNNEVYARRISVISRGVPVGVCPIYSNIGEPEAAEVMQKDPGSWVIFGSADRARNSLRGLERMIKAGKFEWKPAVIRVVAGGLKMQPLMDQVAVLSDLGLNIEVLPNLPGPQVGEVFKKSEFFFTDYLAELDEPWLDMLLKSGTFAAANAHGVVTLIPSTGLGWLSPSTHPGLVCMRAQSEGTASAAPSSGQLRDWYGAQSHSRNLANKINEILSSL